MSTKTISHRVAVIGGGNAGISLAARLRRAGMTDIGIIEPAESHFYQPLWTLVAR
jgi:sulfide:quinone oxidoreductase